MKAYRLFSEWRGIKLYGDTLVEAVIRERKLRRTDKFGRGPDGQPGHILESGETDFRPYPASAAPALVRDRAKEKDHGRTNPYHAIYPVAQDGHDLAAARHRLVRFEEKEEEYLFPEEIEVRDA